VTRRARLPLVLLLGAVLAGCSGYSGLGYYWQAAAGHVRLMRDARPVAEVMADPATPAPLKQKLELTQRIRRYASDELGMPDNSSYTRYADLHRPAALWNVVAAPTDSLTLKTWCFPVAGCVGYRGYYALADAQQEATALREQGLEVAVYPVPAYSTLGWLDWAGGDPLLSSFIGYPEGELARLIFHELAHQVVYVAGDTMFNESFATSVERLGGSSWLRTHAGAQARETYAAFDAQRQQFRALALDTRRRLAAVYAQKADTDEARASMTANKLAVMADFRERYAALRAGWAGPRQRAYDGWVERANNALFATQAAYDELVPGFEALFEQESRKTSAPWPAFFARVRQLADLPKDERDRALREAARGLSAPMQSASFDSAR